MTKNVNRQISISVMLLRTNYKLNNSQLIWIYRLQTTIISYSRDRQSFSSFKRLDEIINRVLWWQLLTVFTADM